MGRRQQDGNKNSGPTKRTLRASTEDWLMGETMPLPANSVQKKSKVAVTKPKKPKAVAKPPLTPTLPTRSPLPFHTPSSLPPANHVSPGHGSLLATSTPTLDEVLRQEGLFTDEESDGDDDNEDEEDGPDVEPHMPVVPPPRQAAEEVVVAQLTVEQLKATIQNYKERYERAERQVRAISKSQLADKFMENEVRKYVKENLWKRCKFITCAETMEECMEEVASQFAINAAKRDHWKSTYAHSVRDALNNRRNNTCQDLKKELSGTYIVVAMVVMCHPIDGLSPIIFYSL